MNRYLVLFRGINVGGKNKISMELLKKCLNELGFMDVNSYIVSGNIILTSDKDQKLIKEIIESNLPKYFTLDSELIKVLVITKKQLKEIVDNKPKSFGEFPDKFHSDVIFLMDLDEKLVFKLFKPREGVDKIWMGKGVIYSERLSEMRTKSRLNIIVDTPEYKSMTIRSWNTVSKLLNLMN